MRSTTIILFLLISSSIVGQKKKQKKTNFILFNPAMDISYGYRNLKNSFYDQLNTIGNFKYDKPLHSVGLGLSDHLNSVKGKVFIRQIFFNQIISQPIAINDSTNFNISGFIASLSTSLNFFRKAKIFRLYWGLGANLGRLKLYKKDQINKTSPIITPKLSLMPSIFINRIYFSFAIEYDHDFLNFDWTNHGNNSLNKIKLNKLQETSLTAFLRLGFFLQKQK